MVTPELKNDVLLLWNLSKEYETATQGKTGKEGLKDVYLRTVVKDNKETLTVVNEGGNVFARFFKGIARWFNRASYVLQADSVTAKKLEEIRQDIESVGCKEEELVDIVSKLSEITGDKQQAVDAIKRFCATQLKALLQHVENSKVAHAKNNEQKAKIVDLFEQHLMLPEWKKRVPVPFTPTTPPPAPKPTPPPADLEKEAAAQQLLEAKRLAEHESKLTKKVDDYLNFAEAERDKAIAYASSAKDGLKQVESATTLETAKNAAQRAREAAQAADVCAKAAEQAELEAKKVVPVDSKAPYGVLITFPKLNDAVGKANEAARDAKDAGIQASALQAKMEADLRMHNQALESMQLGLADLQARLDTARNAANHAKTSDRPRQFEAQAHTADNEAQALLLQLTQTHNSAIPAAKGKTSELLEQAQRIVADVTKFATEAHATAERFERMQEVPDMGLADVFSEEEVSSQAPAGDQEPQVSVEEPEVEPVPITHVEPEVVPVSVEHEEPAALPEPPRLEEAESSKRTYRTEEERLQTGFREKPFISARELQIPAWVSPADKRTLKEIVDHFHKLELNLISENEKLEILNMPEEKDLSVREVAVCRRKMSDEVERIRIALSDKNHSVIAKFLEANGERLKTFEPTTLRTLKTATLPNLYKKAAGEPVAGPEVSVAQLKQFFEKSTPEEMKEYYTQEIKYISALINARDQCPPSFAELKDFLSSCVIDLRTFCRGLEIGVATHQLSELQEHTRDRLVNFLYPEKNSAIRDGLLVKNPAPEVRQVASFVKSLIYSPEQVLQGVVTTEIAQAVTEPVVATPVVVPSTEALLEKYDDLFSALKASVRLLSATELRAQARVFYKKMKTKPSWFSLIRTSETVFGKSNSGSLSRGAFVSVFNRLISFGETAFSEQERLSLNSLLTYEKSLLISQQHIKAQDPQAKREANRVVFFMMLHQMVNKVSDYLKKNALATAASDKVIEDLYSRLGITSGDPKEFLLDDAQISRLTDENLKGIKSEILAAVESNKWNERWLQKDLTGDIKLQPYNNLKTELDNFELNLKL